MVFLAMSETMANACTPHYTNDPLKCCRCCRVPQCVRTRGNWLVEIFCCAHADRTGLLQEADDAEVDIEREERIDCVCGVDGEENYDGLWVQCDSCDAWLHGRCVGIRRTPKGAHQPSTCNANMPVRHCLMCSLSLRELLNHHSLFCWWFEMV